MIPSFEPKLGTVMELLRRSQIIKTDSAKVGTQFKLMFTFDNGIKAIFKPQWYTRTTRIRGTVYHGKDRHNGEVVAFYLSLLLPFRRVPLTFIKTSKSLLDYYIIHAWIS